jgi:NADH:ubiquinone oxidoreductase subunit E
VGEIEMEGAVASANKITCGSLPQQNLSQQVAEILADFKREQSELIPILQRVQHTLGYLPEESLLKIADYLRLSESTVFGVATFYALFKLTPSGKRVIKVCRGTACHVRGGTRILQRFEQRLGIKQGETSPDFENSIQTIACFGSCALAPVVVIGEKVYGRMTSSKVEKILLETNP